MKSSKEFENAIRNKKVPILVLDQKSCQTGKTQ